MSDTTIERPIFYDGQILDASDLGDSVDYARDQLSRHERYGHSWGIYLGFGLKFDRAAGTVTVAAGMAIDGRGRELALLADQSLDPSLFLSANVYDASQKDAWYPVFVRGILNTVPPASSMDACAAASQSTRESEGVQFAFKPLGSVAPNSPSLPIPGPDASPDLPSGGSPWDILIGFVQWDGASQFTAAQSTNAATPPAATPSVSRRLAGVLAARVEGADGAVTLQTRSIASPDQLLVVVQEGDGLTFGAPDVSGGITPLLHVDAQGNLNVQGTITSGSPLPPGTISVQSGVATDGVILPLPPGASESAITSGTIVLHIQVEPVIPDVSKITPNPPFAAVPLICQVDRHRRVHCVIRSLSLSSGNVSSTDTPGACRYLLIAASPGTGGS